MIPIPYYPLSPQCDFLEKGCPPPAAPGARAQAWAQGMGGARGSHWVTRGVTLGGQGGHIGGTRGHIGGTRGSHWGDKG